MHPRVDNNLAALRRRRAVSAAGLARMAGVSRQTVYAMEAGSYVPNTAVALRLAAALETRVEDLFFLPETSAPELRPENAALLAGSDPPRPGQPVQLCRVDRRLIAVPPSPLRWYFPASDAVAARPPAPAGKLAVQVFDPGLEFSNRILAAGCDPGISVLARHMHAAGIEMVFAHRNSAQALDLLKQRAIHIAGTHLRDDSSGESNLTDIGRLFPRGSVAVVAFAVWEEGIVTARGNPRRIRGIEDLAREDVAIVNREPGAGSRRLLDARLSRAGIPRASVHGYDRIAPGHLAAAWQVRTGAADACIATRAAARVFGLGFLPLASERYDLAIRRRHLELPAIQALLDTLSHTRFRRELESLGGYDTRPAGQRLL